MVSLRFVAALLRNVIFKLSKPQRRGKRKTGMHLRTSSSRVTAAAMSQLPSMAPTTVRKSGRCGVSATICWTGHGMVARLSAPITPSARRWCDGSERRTGSAACSKHRLIVLSRSCGSAACRIHHIRINIEKNQKPARSNGLAGFVYLEERAETDLNTEQESKKKIRLCAWISITAVILCAALCVLAVLWSR